MPAKVQGILGQFSAYNRFHSFYVRYGGSLRGADSSLDLSHLVSHGSLEEDLIAWNWAVAYAVEPKGTGT